jgi:alpha-D-xyloside xylohydrolase
MFMRERLRPYLHEQLDKAAADGLPAMRPLFVDFPGDEQAWTIEDQFMFGPDVLVAPVTEAGSRSREVYLPGGSRWTHVWSGETFAGGEAIQQAAPLHEIPVYLRDGAAVPVAGATDGDA